MSKGQCRATDTVFGHKHQRQKNKRKGIFLSLRFERKKKTGERWRKKVRYHIPTVAVACSEYPGEIPEADHMETIGDRQETGDRTDLDYTFKLYIAIYCI